MRFLIDMPLSPQLAEWLRAKGHDAVHAVDLSMQKSPDTEIISIAARDERTISIFLVFWLRSEPADRALIFLRGGNYSEAPISELTRSIAVVDREKIRRRWLPL